MTLNRDVGAAVEARLKAIVGASDYPFFKQSLAEAGGVLSGSFVLQCILGEEWPGSDIDIFVPFVYGRTQTTPYGNATSAIDNWLYAHGARISRPPINAVTTKDAKYGDLFTGKRERVIFFIREYLINGVKFQMIYVNARSSEAVITDVIADGFDFSIIKNAFYVDSANQIHWHVNDWHGIETRTCRFTAAQNVRSTLKRRVKYEQRRFEIRTDDASDILARQIEYDRRSPVKRITVFAQLLQDEDYPPGTPLSEVAFDYESSCDDHECPYNQLVSYHSHRHGGYFEPIGMRRMRIDNILVGDGPFKKWHAAVLVAAIQGLRLPVLILCQILHDADVNAYLQKFDDVWRLAACIRHFHERRALQHRAED